MGSRQSLGSSAKFGLQQPVEVSFADVESCGQTSDARPINLTPFDKAHSPPDEITSVIPLGRTGRRVGAASLA